MKWNGKIGLAVALIGVGALLLLKKLGLPVAGNIMELFIPIAMVLIGWFGIKAGRTTIGWIVLIIGLLALVGALSGLLSFLIPVALIVIGWSLLKNRSKAY